MKSFKERLGVTPKVQIEENAVRYEALTAMKDVQATLASISLLGVLGVMKDTNPLRKNILDMEAKLYAINTDMAEFIANNIADVVTDDTTDDTSDATSDATTEANVKESSFEYKGFNIELSDYPSAWHKVKIVVEQSNGKKSLLNGEMFATNIDEAIEKSKQYIDINL